jgi:hypothetical protein
MRLNVGQIKSGIGNLAYGVGQRLETEAAQHVFRPIAAPDCAAARMSGQRIIYILAYLCGP